MCAAMLERILLCSRFIPADRFWKSSVHCLTERSERVLTQPKIGSMAPPVQQSHERKYCNTKYGNYSDLT